MAERRWVGGGVGGLIRVMSVPGPGASHRRSCWSGGTSDVLLGSVRSNYWAMDPPCTFRKEGGGSGGHGESSMEIAVTLHYAILLSLQPKWYK